MERRTVLKKEAVWDPAALPRGDPDGVRVPVPEQRFEVGAVVAGSSEVHRGSCESKARDTSMLRSQGKHAARIDAAAAEDRNRRVSAELLFNYLREY
jgi:hypothetical protein